MKTVVHRKTDVLGNDFFITQDPAAAPYMFEVFLKIFRENKKRLVGVLDAKNRVLHLSRNRDKHLLHKNDSYGFNYMLFTESLQFDTILLRDEFAAYKIPKAAIPQCGKFLFFKQRGFEKQIFVTLLNLEQYRFENISVNP